ncbi:MAG TPA: nuclear transport factor 2 family protein [Candidatus Angelobacter sp.]|nr:nuclear transport factor 2 family protein [Candidatus Angelobacter sp.]
MKIWILTGLVFVLSSFAASQTKPGTAPPTPRATVPSHVEDLLEANVKAEWDAFKNKDKKAYADLLAEDFIAVEDDGQGMRKKSTAVEEVDRSVVNKYYLVALKVLPVGADAALVTYELTIEFPPKAPVRIKRVLVSELWLKREGKWKLRYYQETRAR